MTIVTGFPKVPKASPPFIIPPGATKMTTPTACGKDYWQVPGGGVYDAELRGDILDSKYKVAMGDKTYHVLPNGQLYNSKLEATLVACRDAPVPLNIVRSASKIGMYGPGEIVFVVQDGEAFLKDGEVYYPGPEDQLVVIKDGDVFTPGGKVFFVLNCEVYPVVLEAQLAILRATWRQFSKAEQQALIKLRAAMHYREQFNDLELDWSLMEWGDTYVGWDPDHFHSVHTRHIETWSKWSMPDRGANGRLVRQVSECTAWLFGFMQKTRNPPPTLSVQSIRNAIQKETGVLVAWNVPLFAADKLKLPVINPETRNYQIVLQPERFGGPPADDQDGQDGTLH